jgi:hypothetical protein
MDDVAAFGGGDVVDEHIDTAERLERSGDNLLRTRRRGQIGGNRDHRIL